MVKELQSKKAEVHLEETKAEKDVCFFLLVLFFLLIIFMVYLVYWSVRSGEIDSVLRFFGFAH